ncbi:MAG: hypothetical protein ACKVYV_08800 [Limisphaerales bacterium]
MSSSTTSASWETSSPASSSKQAMNKTETECSNLPGMGALPVGQNGGTAFRVWAPHAESVAVIGSFNDWNAWAHPLTREEGGTWFGVVKEAAAGQEYRYVIRNGEHEFTRVDPRARRVSNSAGNAVIWHPPERRADAGFPPAAGCTCHLQAARRFLPCEGRRAARHLRLGDREVSLPEGAGRQHGGGDAGGRVRW